MPRRSDHTKRRMMGPLGKGFGGGHDGARSHSSRRQARIVHDRVGIESTPASGVDDDGVIQKFLVVYRHDLGVGHQPRNPSVECVAHPRLSDPLHCGAQPIRSLGVARTRHMLQASLIADDQQHTAERTAPSRARIVNPAMGMYALNADSARVRAGSWRGRDDLAYLVPLSSAATLTPNALEQICDRLRADGYEAVVTAAVGPSEREMLAADGFDDHESLHLLQHDLRDLPSRPGRDRGIRRGGLRRDLDAILAVDAATFEPFWQLDADGLREAVAATAVSRLRVIRDPHIIGYAVTGRAGNQGYLQRLAVAPDRQGEGRGIELVADALHWLRRRQVATCWVNTQEANHAALGLYRKLGFRQATHHLTVLRRQL